MNQITRSQLSHPLHCRIVRQILESDEILRVSLEVQQDNNWIRIVTYRIAYDESCRTELSADGERNVTRIGLPIAQVKQLSENDFHRNWSKYVLKFFELRTPSIFIPVPENSTKCWGPDHKSVWRTSICTIV